MTFTPKPTEAPILFHFDVPGGKWQTRILSPVVLASRCSS
jgi:hypothetical protein